MGCSKELLLYAGSHQSAQMKRGVYSVNFCGGKIYCDDCNIEASNFCVHGYLLKRECKYCPENNRYHSLAELKQNM